MSLTRTQRMIVHNPYQGKDHRVLCVCSVGLLRSPTVARILSQPPYNYNTRACGLDEELALIPISEKLVEWAKLIIVMTESDKEEVLQRFPNRKLNIRNLEIEDSYEYMQEELIQLIQEKQNELR